MRGRHFFADNPSGALFGQGKFLCMEAFSVKVLDLLNTFGIPASEGLYRQAGGSSDQI